MKLYGEFENRDYPTFCDDERPDPPGCEHCDGPLCDEEECESGICNACWDANERAAEEAEQEGMKEVGYSEEAA